MMLPVLIVLHQEHSTPGRIGNALRSRGFTLDIRRPRFDDPLPETLENHTGAVIFGGPQSANDKDDFIRREIDWLQVPLREKKPYLGICLGMQFLAEKSTEWGGYRGLGWIPGVVQRLEPAERTYKVPHIGWNELEFPRPSALYADLEEPPVYYFVHSYHFVPAPEATATVTATCGHGETVIASVERGNIFGVQFHPEKSQRVGLQLLRNFAERIVPARA
jgi:imidazole glycerol phosphate synthase glutamine amidotransferase subunit